MPPNFACVKEVLELVLKVPQNKPPFIGIAYESHLANAAEATNSDLFAIKERPFEIYMQVYRDHLSLRLQVAGMVDIRFYSKVVYDRTQLGLWLKSAKEAKKINFGHVIKRQGRMEVAKVWKSSRPFFFPVHRVYIISEKDEKILRIFS